MTHGKKQRHAEREIKKEEDRQRKTDRVRNKTLHIRSDRAILAVLVAHSNDTQDNFRRNVVRTQN